MGKSPLSTFPTVLGRKSQPASHPISEARSYPPARCVPPHPNTAPAGYSDACAAPFLGGFMWGSRRLSRAVRRPGAGPSPPGRDEGPAPQGVSTNHRTPPQAPRCSPHTANSATTDTPAPPAPTPRSSPAPRGREPPMKTSAATGLTRTRRPPRASSRGRRGEEGEEQPHHDTDPPLAAGRRLGTRCSHDVGPPVWRRLPRRTGWLAVRAGGRAPSRIPLAPSAPAGPSWGALDTRRPRNHGVPRFRGRRPHWAATLRHGCPRGGGKPSGPARPRTGRRQGLSPPWRGLDRLPPPPEARPAARTSPRRGR